MSLRIRRGTNAQRTGITFDLGEIVYTTDTQKLYIGDGVTAGGKNLLETSSGYGFTFNQATQQIDFSLGNLNLNTSQVTENSNLYFTTERAQDAVGSALVAGNSFNTGITFTYDDANNRITAVSGGGTGGGLTDIVLDTSPSLGGNLDLNSHDIDGTGNININGNVATYEFVNTTTDISSNLGGYRARGTEAVPLTVTASDQLIKISAQGYSSGSYKTSSIIASAVSTRFPVTSTVVPGRINFITADGSGNLNTGLYLDADMGTRLQMFSPDLTQLGIYSYLISAGGNGTYTNFGRTAGTTTAQVALTTGDKIHTLRFMGYDGTTLLTGSQISSTVYGAVSTGQLQTDIRIQCRNSSGVMTTTQSNTASQVRFSVMPILPTFAGTSAATTAVSNTVTLSGTITVATGGAFTLGTSFAGNLAVGKQITISGTLSGATITGYADPTTYFITATNGSTTFTLSTTSGGGAITTTAGTLTGATLVLTTVPLDGMMFYDSVALKITAYANGAWVAVH